MNSLTGVLPPSLCSLSSVPILTLSSSASDSNLFTCPLPVACAAVLSAALNGDACTWMPPVQSRLVAWYDATMSAVPASGGTGVVLREKLSGATASTTGALRVAANGAGANGASAAFNYLSGTKTGSVVFAGANVAALPYSACGVSRYTVPTSTSYAVLWGASTGYGISMCANCVNGGTAATCLANGWSGFPTEASCFQKCLATSSCAYFTWYSCGGWCQLMAAGQCNSRATPVSMSCGTVYQMVSPLPGLRVITSSTANWILGHWAIPGDAGVSFAGTFFASAPGNPCGQAGGSGCGPNPHAQNTNWAVTCMSIPAAGPVRVLVDGADVSLGYSSNPTVTPPAGQLAINPATYTYGSSSEYSAFGFAELLLWNTSLNAFDLAAASTYLAGKYGTPSLAVSYAYSQFAVQGSTGASPCPACPFTAVTAPQFPTYCMVASQAVAQA